MSVAVDDSEERSVSGEDLNPSAAEIDRVDGPVSVDIEEPRALGELTVTAPWSPKFRQEPPVRVEFLNVFPKLVADVNIAVVIDADTCGVPELSFVGALTAPDRTRSAIRSVCANEEPVTDIDVTSRIEGDEERTIGRDTFRHPRLQIAAVGRKDLEASLADDEA